MRKKGVISAEAGIQYLKLLLLPAAWMPAGAGMTNYDPAS